MTCWPAALAANVSTSRVHSPWFLSERQSTDSSLINGLLIGLGVRPLKGALPYVAVCGTLTLALLAYRALKRLWKSDMQAKAASVARRIETGCGGIILQPKPDERRLNVAFPKTEQVE